MEQTADAVGECGAAPPHGDARDLWRAIGSLIAEMVLQIWPDGTICHVSRPPHGLSANALLGCDVVDMLDPTLRADARAWLARVTVDAAPRRRVLQVQLPDGTRRWFETVSVPVARDGRVAALTIAARDLSPEAGASARSAVASSVPGAPNSDQLQRLQLSALLAVGLVHDFNNVLAVIGSATSMLLESVTLDDPLRADLENIQTAIAHGSGLTRRLLDLSRRRDSLRGRVELNEVVHDVARMARLFLGKDVRLLTQLEPSGAPVSVHRGDIEQVLLNLLLNARDATPGDGSITISTCRLTYSGSTAPPGCRLRGAVVRLRVKDTGSGIDDVTRARIFEPFFTTKAPERGTGLGLPTVAAIVKEAGGCVELASRSGAGTTVDVVLPDADRAERCVA